jgi:hypothetical protein
MASVIAHVVLIELIILFAGVEPYSAKSVEPISVDLVTPQEAEAEKEPAPQPQQSPSSEASLTTKDVSAGPTNPFTSAPPSNPRQPPPQASDPSAAAAPQPPPANVSQPPLAAASQPAKTPPAPPSPGYVRPDPDITVKYHVMLGLPVDLPRDAPPAVSADASRDGGDGRDSTASDVGSSVVAAFRSHLKTCSKLPASVTTSDDFRIRMQVLMRPDGGLAAEPIMVEAPQASQKVVDFRDSAVRAIMACAPYTMLPSDRYREWKVLDLSLRPRDFAS